MVLTEREDDARVGFMSSATAGALAAQKKARQHGREEPSAGAVAAQHEVRQHGREEPCAQAEQGGDGRPMHWLTLVFSDPEEEMLFRRSVLVESKTTTLALFGIGLSFFVVMWVSTAWRGQVIHALWTPWSIGVLTMTMTLMSEHYTLNSVFTVLPPAAELHPVAAGCVYFLSCAQAQLHGLEPLAGFEFAAWCGAGLLQLLIPFLLAYPPQSKVEVFLVNFVGYSVLALAGYFGERLRAICIGGFLLNSSLALGYAFERAKRLTFLHVRREAAMVEVHVAKEPDERAPCKRRLQRRPPTSLTAVLILAHAPLMLLALLMVEVSWLVPACGVSSSHWVGPHAAPSPTSRGLLRPVHHLGRNGSFCPVAARCF